MSADYVRYPGSFLATPADPPVFTSSEPNWRVGDPVLVRPGVKCIVAIQAVPDDAHGVWFVEPRRPPPRGAGDRASLSLLI